ncbi:to g1 s-specific cyclin [Malassezia pachydermatis]|uniref:To g1 s-specific cyclin n=1 Tax=Malassezia pachydermatis TaxID=77020 RepID=A0A0M8MQH8_9BASI|nr:to g1 s-specific cyclin [Malassezia pachydermatis]KOS16298.1 to g1 s-specific cyclin [Malassezia pachydermatis]
MNQGASETAAPVAAPNASSVRTQATLGYKAQQRHSTILTSSQNLFAKASQKPAARHVRSSPSSILFEAEYQQEIFEYMHVMEKQTMPNIELMSVQPELHWFMRPYLVDFLIEIHQSFRLRPETLYLTMNLVDRYVSRRIVYKRHYQLVGCAALLIAAKFEDSKDRVPTVQELSQMCCNAYDPGAFTQMEGHVLSTLGWCLGHPTAESWLRYEYSCAPPSVPSTHSVARFLLEVTLFHESFIPMLPSTLAAGAMLLARHICRDPRLQPHPLGAVATQAANQIYQFVLDHQSDISSILIKKYSYSYYAEASTLAMDWFKKRAEIKKAVTPKPAYRMETHSSDDEADSMHSTESAGSVFSTPSRSMTRDDDDDESMPVTPMSLHSVQDTSFNSSYGTHPPSRFVYTNSLGNRNVLPDSNKSSSSWMSLVQLRPVAKHKMARMDMDVHMEEKTT